MIKKNKWKLMLASLVMLLPILVGVILWDRLPELMSIHWGLDGAEDGVGGRAFVVFGMSLILLALFWLGLWVTAWDHKKREQDPKVLGMVFAILPLVSLWINGMLYATALGLPVNPMIFVCPLLGIVLLVTGNYMPKCRPNRTIGIKTKYTLANEENWNASHRFAGRIWFACGILMLLCAFLPMPIFPWAMGVVLLAVILPTAIYPYAYAKKQIREGSATKEDFKTKKGKLPLAVSLALVAVLLALVAVVLFTGSVKVYYGESDFTVSATYTGTTRIVYEDVESVEYREELSRGYRVAGFGTPRLMVGSYQNEEFGIYRLYAYATNNASVVMHMKDGKTVVLGGSDAEEARAIYLTLSEEIKN